MTDWNEIPNFSAQEFRCKCGCESDGIDEDFVYKIQDLRDRCNFPFRITSGYRCEDHPAEAKRAAEGKIGPHTTGRACDVAVIGHDAYTLIKHATNMGFTGIGVQQRGDKRFIHLDDLAEADGFPRPWVWSY